MRTRRVSYRYSLAVHIFPAQRSLMSSVVMPKSEPSHAHAGIE